MRALLDVNILIALLDADHIHHRDARTWLLSEVSSGWASCPITVNGCIRVMSQARYPNPVPAGEIIKRMRRATATPQHEFWPDDMSILDPSLVDPSRVHGPKQVTDVYLLALAVKHLGRFVTFDGAVPLSAVRGADQRHLIVI